MGKTVCVIGSAAGPLINFRGALLGAMREAGHRVIAMAPAIGADIASKLEALGVEPRSVPLDRNGLSLRRDFTTLRALYRVLSEIKPDAVLGYTIKPVLYGSLAARSAGVPARFSMITGLGYAFLDEGGWKQRLVGTTARLLYRMSLRANERVFFQNPDDRALFERLRIVRGPEQAVMINGSGVDIEAFQPVPLPETPSFLLIARLLADKGIREYVEAARLLRARHPEVKCRLVGPADNNPAAISEREVQSWVEEGVVEYLGRLQDVRPAIAAASVYVLPSYYPEGQPRSILEAMAMGRPIITTDSRGCRETVEPGRNGLLVPARDVPALAAAMERLILEPERAVEMGRESRRIAESKYDVNHVNAVILDAMGLA